MKYLFCLLSFVFSLNCNAQSDTFKIGGGSPLIIGSVVDPFYSPSMHTLTKDTLVVFLYPGLKFLKIGDRVYKINSPTLTEIYEQPEIINRRITRHLLYSDISTMLNVVPEKGMMYAF